LPFVSSACQSSLPKTKEAFILGQQILRSGTSVGANYREANRARSKAEFIAKVGDCLKEADETLYWLELITASEIMPVPRLQPLTDECNELLAILTTIHKHAKAK
jgi:four helix bundle protein